MYHDMSSERHLVREKGVLDMAGTIAIKNGYVFDPLNEVKS